MIIIKNVILQNGSTLLAHQMIKINKNIILAFYKRDSKERHKMFQDRTTTQLYFARRVSNTECLGLSCSPIRCEHEDPAN